jgi:hypothetical protein
MSKREKMVQECDATMILVGETVRSINVIMGFNNRPPYNKPFYYECCYAAFIFAALQKNEV